MPYDRAALEKIYSQYRASASNESALAYAKALENAVASSADLDDKLWLCDDLSRLLSRYRLAEIAVAYADALCSLIFAMSGVGDIRAYCETIRTLSEDYDSSDIDYQYMRALYTLFLNSDQDGEILLRRMEGLYSRRPEGRIAYLYSILHTPQKLDPGIVAVGHEYRRDVYFKSIIDSSTTEDYIRNSPYIEDFVEPYVGEIYHYTALTAVVNIISHGELWATQCDFLNDTEERRYITNFLSSKRYDGIRGYVENALGSENYQAPKNTSKLERVVADMNRDIFIISFSKDGDSLTLWSGYTNKCGFNIGFDSMRLFYRNTLNEFRGDADCMVGGLVAYRPTDRPFIELDDTVDSIIRDSKRHGLTDEQTQCVIAAHVMYAGFFLKSSSMAAENEYRLVYMPVDKRAIDIRCKGNIPIPYTVYHDERLIRSSIKSICIGPTNEGTITSKGIHYLVSSTPGISESVKIEKSRVSLRY